MKKALFFTLAFVLVAGLAVGAYAEDRFKVNGSYRVRGFYTENFAVGGGQSDFNSDSKTNNFSYFDQRFRLGGVITAAEGITANFRMDFGEETWGIRETGISTNASTGVTSITSAAPGNGRPTERAELQVDRLYLRLEREMFNFVAGQFDGAFGFTSAFETQKKWLLLRLKTPVIIDLAYIKIDEGSGTTDETSLNTEDDSAYGLNVLFNQEAFGVGAFLGYRQNKTSFVSASLTLITPSVTSTAGVNDNTLSVLGLYGNFNAGMFTFRGEFDYFDGENELKGSGVKTDVKGQQLWLFGDLRLSETMRVPINFVYAKGYADKSNETQAFQLAPAFGDFVPQSMANWVGDYLIFPGGEVFDPAGNGGGAMGLMVGFDFVAAETHNFYTQLGYIEPDTVIDVSPSTGLPVTDQYESQMWIQGSWVWNVLPQTDLGAILIYQQASFKNQSSTFKDDAGYALLTKLQVRF